LLVEVHQDAGRIAWDGTDTAAMDAGQMRRRMAVIFQDFARYDLTARENIGLGAVEHIDDPDAVRTAARHAVPPNRRSALTISTRSSQSSQ
jgi:ATP-binding cassette, subfamily B, bacterial